MSPDNWTAVAPGMGSCFHQALHRWALLHAADSTHGFRIAIGVVGSSPWDLHRHLHAWLERGDVVLSAVSGEVSDRREFYCKVNVEAHTVKLVNPRKLMRASKWTIERATVQALLDASGIAWREVNGGVLPAA